jgi:ArsR family transcriptional regulator
MTTGRERARALDRPGGTVLHFDKYRSDDQKGPLKMKAKQLAKIMKALSNENRLKLYLEIAKHEESDFEEQRCNLSDIVKIFGLSPPTISHHLKELANADLIVTEKRGKYLVARINKETLGAVKQLLAEIDGE